MTVCNATITALEYSVLAFLLGISVSVLLSAVVSDVRSAARKKYRIIRVRRKA